MTASIWAIADLHLSFGVPDKGMEVFGPQWQNHAQRIAEKWMATIAPQDLVLIAGDISWAMKIADALPDLAWIDRLPGTKVMIRGNHDFWWGSLKQVREALPPSIHAIQNDAFSWQGLSIAGSRLWDTHEYSFGPYINFIANDRVREKEDRSAEAEKTFVRELSRLETSLKSMSKQTTKRLVMTHYPPISADLQDSRASQLLEKYHVDTCVFGHLHSVKKEIPLFGTKKGISYYLTSCDYLDFQPLKVGSL